MQPKKEKKKVPKEPKEPREPRDAVAPRKSVCLPLIAFKL